MKSQQWGDGKGFVLPSNCIDDQGLPAFCVFHGTKSVNNGVMCKGVAAEPLYR